MKRKSKVLKFSRRFKITPVEKAEEKYLDALQSSKRVPRILVGPSLQWFDDQLRKRKKKNKKKK